MYLLSIKKASRCWKHCWLVPKKGTVDGKQIDKPSKGEFIINQKQLPKV